MHWLLFMHGWLWGLFRTPLFYCSWKGCQFPHNEHCLQSHNSSQHQFVLRYINRNQFISRIQLMIRQTVVGGGKWLRVCKFYTKGFGRFRVMRKQHLVFETHQRSPMPKRKKKQFLLLQRIFLRSFVVVFEGLHVVPQNRFSVGFSNVYKIMEAHLFVLKNKPKPTMVF